MLKTYVREATHTTPAIHLDAESGLCTLIGRSMPIDAGAFYNPILDWLVAYSEEPASETRAVFDLDYFNSSSSLMLGRIFQVFSSIPRLTVQWLYHPDDEDILEAGQEFARLCSARVLMEVKAAY